MKHHSSGQDILLPVDIHCQKICSEYGLFGNFFYYAPSPIDESDRNRLYFIAGIDPSLGSEALPAYVYPEDLLRRQQRCNKLFYPQVYVIDFTEGDSRKFVSEELVEYCKKAEFLQTLYAQYGMDVPPKLRLNEVSRLSEFFDILHNPDTDPRIRKKCQKDLDWFFRRERSTGFRKRWLDYYRSDRFPDDRGPVGRIIGYLRRNRQKTDILQLMDCSEKLHKLVMQEHEYKYFIKHMRELYPDVSYCSGPKEIINNGVHNPKHSESVLGKRITGEEYAALRSARFAEEGWEFIADCKEGYFELRDVYYKACDEPLVASVYHSITLGYAKCNGLEELTRIADKSPLRLADISASDFMNFVSLAKANHLRFYIDNTGQYAIPALGKIRVIYNQHQGELLQSILTRMTEDKVAYSHLSGPKEPCSSLTDVLARAETEKAISPAVSVVGHNYERE